MALTLVERFEHLARQALCGRARLVKRIGDAVMVVAPDPADGVATARKLLTHATMDSDLPAVATGIHHGSAVVSGGDVVGAAVNLASHLSDHAAPGEVLCTEPVAQALQADERVVVRDRGARDVGSLRATSLYELSWPREMVETVTARRSPAPGVGAAGGS